MIRHLVATMLVLGPTSGLSQPAQASLQGARAPASRDRPAQQDRMPGGAQVYAWRDGGLYILRAAPEQLTDIALEPGETLNAVAAGDTSRWTVGDTTSGSGDARRTHILIKPFAAGLRTNLVITTDRRVYRLQLESHARGAMSAISWTYTEDALIALRRREAEAAAARPVAAGIAVDSLNFNYAIEGDRPAWRPVRVFDDGRQTFIEFPASIAVGEAPPLFLVGEGGAPALVNYRMSGRYYVVDRLFEAAELRLGARRQQIVRISRAGAGRAARRGRGA